MIEITRPAERPFTIDDAEYVTIKDGEGHYFELPSLTTPQRDSLSPNDGMMIYNSTTKQVEAYQDGSWGPMGGASALGDLTDVTITSVGDNEVLAYDSTAGEWVNQTPSEAGVLAADGSVPLAGNLNANGHDISDLGKLNFDTATELTISSGAITITQTLHTVDTEGDASTDDLDTINGGTPGDVLYLRAADGTRTVVLKHGTGNIVTPDGNDYSLDDANKEVQLRYGSDSKWHLIGSAGGGGGSQTPWTSDIDAEGHNLLDLGYGEFRYIPGDTAQRTLVARFQGVTKEDKTIYVRTDGNDSNDGSADDSSHALQTVQKAVDIVSKLVIKDDITISLAAGTYSEQVNIGPLMFAGGSLTIVGDPTTPSNVVIDPGTSDFGFYITASILTIRGVKVTGATTLGIKIDNKSSVTLDRVEVVSNDSIGIGVYNQSVLTLYGDATTTAKVSSNGNRGIYLGYKSVGLIGVSSGKYVEISDNGNRGIWVDNNSWVTVYRCQIDGNSSDGIYLAYQSMGRLYRNDTDTSNNNSGYGVKCEYHSKAYVYGDDSLTGSSGDVYPSSGANLVNNGDTSAVIDVST